ncbi:MAG: amidase [Bacteroidales bacterium]
MNSINPKNAVITIVIPILILLASCINKHETDFNDFRFIEYDVEQIQVGLNEGDFSVEDIVKAYIDRIESIDRKGPELNSIITVNPDAIKIAKELDKELKKGRSRGPMHGIPVVLKDNIDTHDKMPTTAGSRALRNSYPLKDSHVAKKLREAGAIILGKANLSEWANFRGHLSSSGWSAVGGLTKNPYNLTRNPCGSSSGSAVAVSANLTMLAIGTETNGSIVCPSHANGIVGLKPTVGLISRSGVIPISYTQDSPGPMGRSVKDVAICLGTLVGIDSVDNKTRESQGKFFFDYTQFLKDDGLKGKRLGYFSGPQGTNFKVDTLMNQTVQLLKSEGVEIIEIKEISESSTGFHSFEVMLFEYKEGLNKYFESLGPKAPIKSLEELIAFNKADSVELKYFNQRYLEMAQEKSDLSSEEYQDALSNLMTQSREKGIDKVMDEHNLDAIIAPTGGPAWKTDLINGDSFQLGSSSPSAHSGYPIITMPMGSIDGLPVGMSIFGRAWSEPVLLEIAYAFEAAKNHRIVPEYKKD